MAWRSRRHRARHRRAPSRRAVLATRASLAALVVAAGVGASAAAGVFGSPGRHGATRTAQAAGTAPGYRGTGRADRQGAGGGRASTASSGAASPPRATLPPVHQPATTSTAPAPSPSSTAAPTTTAAAPVPPEPSQVLVEVLNGSGVGGAATAAGAALRRAGFLLNGTGNAANFRHRVTLVLYPPGGELAGETLAAHVAGQVELEASSAVPAGVVDLVLGDSFQGITAG